MQKIDIYKHEYGFKSCIETKDFRRLMYLYGHDTLMQLLNIYQKEQNFEDCALIREAVKQHNSQVNDSLEVTPNTDKRKIDPKMTLEILEENIGKDMIEKVKIMIDFYGVDRAFENTIGRNKDMPEDIREILYAAYKALE